MIDFIVQFLGTALLFAGLWLMGNKRLLGPFLAFIAELFIVVVGLTHGAWSIVVIGIGLGFIQARNFFKWKSEGAPW